MEAVLAAVKDTPIPTILILSGVFFLLLSIADRLPGKVVITPDRRRMATAIGAMFVVSGVVLYYAPCLPLGSQSSVTRVTLPPPATPAVQPTGTGDDGKTELRFFEGECYNAPPPKTRTYRHQFSRAVTRSIYAEIALDPREIEKDTYLTLQAVYMDDGGTPIVTRTANSEIRAGLTQSLHSIGAGWCDAGRWGVGAYRVDFYVNGDKITSGSFSVMP